MGLSGGAIRGGNGVSEDSRLIDSMKLLRIAAALAGTDVSGDSKFIDRVNACRHSLTGMFAIYSGGPAFSAGMYTSLLGWDMPAIAIAACSGFAMGLGISIWTFRELWRLSRRSERVGVTVTQPPGAGMLRIAEFLFSNKRFKRVFSPLIFDMRDEYFAAVQSGCTRKAQWIRVKYSLAFVYNLGACRLLDVIARIWRMGG